MYQEGAGSVRFVSAPERALATLVVLWPSASERDRWGQPLFVWRGYPVLSRRDAMEVGRGHRKGTKGVSTDGVTANCMFVDRGTFCGTPVNRLLPSQKCLFSYKYI